MLGREVGAFIARTDAEIDSFESEARLRGILEAALDAVVSTDTNSRVVEWNPAAEALFGFGRDEVIGRDVAELIIPERFRAAHRLGMERYLATGEGPVLAQRLEMPALRRDRSEFTVEMYIVPIAPHGGQVRLFTSYLRDATGRRRAEREVEYHKHVLSELCEMGTSALMVVNGAGRVVCHNEKFAKLWPVPKEVLASGDAEAILIWTAGLVEDTCAFMDTLNKARRDPAPRTTHSFRLRDGRVIERNGKRVARDGDTGMGWVWSFRELSDAPMDRVHSRANRAA